MLTGTLITAFSALTFLAVNAQTAEPSNAATSTKKKVWATRAQEKIIIDGHLDESAWKQAAAATDFTQKFPYEGEPATERSEVYFLYDRDTLYVGAVLYNSKISELVTDELKRDFSPPQAGDLFVVLLDTFHDGRNCYAFETNPGGAIRELQSFDQGRLINTNWDTVWYVDTSLFEEGWIVEMAIPFKSLRFPKTQAQVWGLQIEHFIRRNNEDTYWSPIPRQFILFDMTYAGELHGLEGIRTGRNLRITPFVVSTIGTKTEATASGTELDWDGGVDAKYGIGTGVVLDATYRTDFSQVEVDEQQINLTRFNLFFPEKRVFFLENAGFFQVGDQLPRLTPSPRGVLDILPFFSRRIGLSDAGEVIPIEGGVRLTGKIGRTQVGLLDIQTEAGSSEGKNNYAMARVAREVFHNSSIGGFFFNRDGNLPGDYNRVFGLDGKFTLFQQRMDINAYLMESNTFNLPDDLTGRVTLSWNTNKQDMFFTATSIGDEFRNDFGFTTRTGVNIFTGEIAQKFRPQATYRWIREYVPQINYDVLIDHQRNMVTRLVSPQFSMDFAEGSSFSVRHDFQFERLLEPFAIHPSATIPSGDYEFGSTRIAMMRDASHTISGNASYSWGTFYDGNITSWELGGRWRQSERLAIASKFARSVVTLPHGSFTTELSSLRGDYSFSTRMFLNTLVQYNSQLHSVVTNIRFNFMYKPLSDLFIVYTRNDVTVSSGQSAQAFIVKYTYMFDF